MRNYSINALFFLEFVVCAYEDGALQKFTPAQISTKFFRPRFSKLYSYDGIEELQKGLVVRCFWNSRFPHSKANIIGVGSAAEMDELYDKATLETDRGDNAAVSRSIEHSRSSRFDFMSKTNPNPI